jgi:hypothetical protein
MAAGDDLKRSTVKKLLDPVIDFLLAALLFNVLFYILRQFNQSSLLFDQLIIIGALSFLIIFFFRFLTKKLDKKIMQTILLVLTLVLFSQSIFLNVDRSRSTYLLSWVNLNKVEYNSSELDLYKVLSSESSNVEAISSRLKEQIDRGLIKVSDENKLSLTRRGKFIVQLSEFLSKVYHLEGWQRNAT